MIYIDAEKAKKLSRWNNVPGDIQDEIIRQIECGASHAIVSEDHMHELAMYSLQQLGYGIFHKIKENKYKIVW